MAEKVPSPIWLELDKLYKDVKKNMGAVTGALKSADKLMDGGKGTVWVGPTARTWGSDLSGASKDMSKQVNAFLEEVHRQLTSHPKEVTPEEANMERRSLAGRF